MKTFSKTIVAALLAVAPGAPSAHAGVLGFETNFNYFNVSSIEKAVPLTDSGARTIAFRTTKANSYVSVIYNAECSVKGGTGDWLSVRIVVDGRNALPAAGRDFALCSDDGGLDETYIAASRQTLILVPQAGLHSVQVYAVLQYASFGVLDDSSIVIRD